MKPISKYKFDQNMNEILFISSQKIYILKVTMINIVKEKIRVALRVRCSKDSKSKNEIIIKAKNLDFVFDEFAPQRQIFLDCVQPKIDTFLSGVNSSICVYGENKSGKKYTCGIIELFQSSTDNLFFEINEDSGFVIRTINEVLKFYYKSEEAFKVYFSIIQIFNEKIQDLLNPNEVAIAISEVFNTTVLQNVIEIEFETVEKLNQKLNDCKKKLNSKANIIFNIEIEKIISGEIKRNKMSFICVTGSGRNILSQTSYKSDKLSNFQSILALNTVISKLSTNSKFIPYNISKLTLVMKQILGGNFETLFFACVIPENIIETLATLEVSFNAQKILNNIIVSNNQSSLNLVQGNIKVRKPKILNKFLNFEKLK